MRGKLVFKLEHLDRFAVITEPCTIIVKNNSKVTLNDIYTRDGKPRWVLMLKAITAFNLALLKELSSDIENTIMYSDIGHLLMKGAIWEDQITNESELPSKGEEMIAVFDYVNGNLLCTNITLIPRKQPTFYNYASDFTNELLAFEKLINNKNRTDDEE